MIEDCGACGDERIRIYSPVGKTNLIRCPHCGCWNRDVAREYKEINVPDNRNWGSYEDQLARAVVKYDWIVKKLELSSGMKVYDVACGTGWFMKIAADLGCVVNGCDINEWNVQKARELVGVDHVDVGCFENATLKMRTRVWDVIVFHHGIEHMIDPYECVMRSFTMLKSGGKLFMSHPCIPSDDRIEEFATHTGGEGGHLYEWTYESFFVFINQFKDGFAIEESSHGIPTVGVKSPPSQTWVLRKK